MATLISIGPRLASLVAGTKVKIERVPKLRKAPEEGERLESFAAQPIIVEAWTVTRR